MSNKFKISTARLAEIIREEYALIQEEISSGEVSEKKKFPDLTGDGKVTQADILKGRGVDLDDEDSDEEEEDKDDKKAQKESVDSIRDLIRKELESL